MYHKSHLWNCTCRSWWLIVASILVFNCNEVLNEFQFAMPYAHLCRTHHPVISVTWSNNSEVTQHPSSNRPGSKAFIRANISWQILNCWTWGMKWKMHLIRCQKRPQIYSVYIYINYYICIYLCVHLESVIGRPLQLKRSASCCLLTSPFYLAILDVNSLLAFSRINCYMLPHDSTKRLSWSKFFSHGEVSWNHT